jgi:hypothetical protein
MKQSKLVVLTSEVKRILIIQELCRMLSSLHASELKRGVIDEFRGRKGFAPESVSDKADPRIW